MLGDAPVAMKAIERDRINLGINATYDLWAKSGLFDLTLLDGHNGLHGFRKQVGSNQTLESTHNRCQLTFFIPI